MKKFDDPIEKFGAEWSQAVHDLSEENKEDFRRTAASKTLPYTVGFIISALLAFGAFAMFIRP